MVSRFRKVMQAGVTAHRDLTQITARRHIPDLAVSTAALAIHETSLALEEQGLYPAASKVDTIVGTVRNAIATLDATGMRGDVSGMDVILDPVSRAICEQQLGTIDTVFLLDAVMLGVEMGLRDLVSASTKRITQVRIRDGPPSTHRPAMVRQSPPSVSSPIPHQARADAKQARTPVPSSQGTGMSPIKPDTDDI